MQDSNAPAQARFFATVVPPVAPRPERVGSRSTRHALFALRLAPRQNEEKGEDMKKVSVGLFVVPVALVAAAVALAGAPPATTFVAVLSVEEEVPLCAAATNAARGVATFHVKDEASGTVEFQIVANNLPGDIVAAHVHIAPKGVAGPVVQPLPLTPGEEQGVVAEGSFSNPALVSAIRANPDGFYVNVHTSLPEGCPSGVIRGQLGDRGPANN